MLWRFAECLAASALVAASLSSAERVLADDPPYPPSPVIAEITWDWETLRTA